MNKALKVVGGATILAILGCVLMVTDVQLRYLDRVRSRDEIATVPQTDVIMVLGASVKSDGEPSDALRDRLLTGVELYRDGKAPNILLTGDDGGFRADEITVMRDFLLEEGMPAEAVRADGQGYRTYESCKRAKLQGIRSAIVVTQRFHLARALYICDRLGVEAHGMVADRQSYVRIMYFWTRDLLASVKAWWDVNVMPPKSPIERP